MASSTQKSFRLPVDVIERLNEIGNVTEFVVTALREKFERDELERFRASARRIAQTGADERDVEFGLAAQAEVISAG